MLRILYVEDNAANVSLVMRVARVGGHEVVNRTSGEAALMDINSIKPHLILMDIQLEGPMNGLDVVRKLRSDGSTVPIIAVTAYAMKGDREKALEAGCDAYLPKPIPIADLVKMIQQVADGSFTPHSTRKPATTSDEEPAADAAPPQSPAVTVSTSDADPDAEDTAGITETAEAPAVSSSSEATSSASSVENKDDPVGT